MKLISLCVENFRTFKGKHEIYFGPESTLIIGSNGSGKSSIVSAISILFDVDYKLKADAMLNVLYRLDNKDADELMCTVSAKLESGDDGISFGKKISVKTRLRRNRQVIVFQINGTDVGEEEYWEKFREICTHAHFSVIYQNYFKDLAKKDGYELVKIFEKISGSTVYKDRSESLQNECNKCKKDLRRIELKLKSMPSQQDGENLEELERVHEEAQTLFHLGSLWKIDQEIQEKEVVVAETRAEEERISQQRNEEKKIALETRIEANEAEIKESEHTVRTSAELTNEIQLITCRLQRIEEDMCLAKMNISTQEQVIEEFDKKISDSSDKIIQHEKSCKKLLRKDFFEPLEKHILEEVLQANYNFKSNNSHEFQSFKMSKENIEKKIHDMKWNIVKQLTSIDDSNSELNVLSEEKKQSSDAAGKISEKIVLQRSEIESLKQTIEEGAKKHADITKDVEQNFFSNRNAKYGHVHETVQKLKAVINKEKLLGTLGDLIAPKDDSYGAAFDRVFRQHLNDILFALKKSLLDAVKFIKLSKAGVCKLVLLPEVSSESTRIPKKFEAFVLPVESICKFITDDINDEVKARVQCLVRDLSRNIVFCHDEEIAVELSMKLPMAERLTVVLPDGTFLSSRGILELKCYRPVNRPQRPEKSLINMRYKYILAKLNYDEENNRQNRKLQEMQSYLQELENAYEEECEQVLRIENKVDDIRERINNHEELLEAFNKEYEAFRKSPEVLEYEENKKKLISECIKVLKPIMRRFRLTQKQVKEVLKGDYEISWEITSENDLELEKNIMEDELNHLKTVLKGKQDVMKLLTKELTELTTQRDTFLFKIQRSREALNKLKTKSIISKERKDELLRELRKDKQQLFKIENKKTVKQKRTVTKRVVMLGLDSTLRQLLRKRNQHMVALNKNSMLQVPEHTESKDMPYDLLPEEAKTSRTEMNKLIASQEARLQLIKEKSKSKIFGGMKAARRSSNKVSRESLEESKASLCAKIRSLSKQQKLMHQKSIELFTSIVEGVQNKIPVNYRWITNGQMGTMNMTFEVKDRSQPFDSHIQLTINLPRQTDDKPTHFEFLSKGQKALAALALIFTIQEAIDSPFLVLDEADGSLSEDSAFLLAQNCRDYASMSRQVIYISHRKSAVLALQGYIVGFIQKATESSTFYYYSYSEDDVEDLNEELPSEFLEQLEPMNSDDDFIYESPIF